MPRRVNDDMRLFSIVLFLTFVGGLFTVYAATPTP